MGTGAADGHALDALDEFVADAVRPDPTDSSSSCPMSARMSSEIYNPPTAPASLQNPKALHKLISFRRRLGYCPFTMEQQGYVMFHENVCTLPIRNGQK